MLLTSKTSSAPRADFSRAWRTPGGGRGGAARLEVGAQGPGGGGGGARFGAGFVLLGCVFGAGVARGASPGGVAGPPRPGISFVKARYPPRPRCRHCGQRGNRRDN